MCGSWHGPVPALDVTGVEGFIRKRGGPPPVMAPVPFHKWWQPVRCVPLSAVAVVQATAAEVTIAARARTSAPIEQAMSRRSWGSLAREALWTARRV